jgi:two-component SAPR family response regulator
MYKVLVADNDLSSHELVRSILHINFRDVTIDSAWSKESLLNKVLDSQSQFDLILFNPELDESGMDTLMDINESNPEILEKVVVIADHPLNCDPSLKMLPFIPKPFSLDYFSEVLKNSRAS